MTRRKRRQSDFLATDPEPCLLTVDDSRCIKEIEWGVIDDINPALPSGPETVGIMIDS